MTHAPPPRVRHPLPLRLFLFLLTFLHLMQAQAMVAPAAIAFQSSTLTAVNFSNSSTLGAYRNLSLTNSGQLVAGQDATLNVTGAFTNSGTVETGRDLAITAGSLSNGTGTTSNLSFGQSTSMADYRTWVLTYITDPVVQGKLFGEIAPDSRIHNSRFFLINRWAYFMDSGLIGPYFSLTITQTTGDAELNAGRHLTANIGGSFSNNSSSVSAGGNIAITAGTFGNNAAQNTYHANVFAGGGGDDLIAYGNSAAIVQAGGSVSIVAGSSNTGTIQGNSVYIGGSLVNGLTSYHQPTPATTLPHAVIDLSGAPTDANGIPLPAVPGAPSGGGSLPGAPAAPAGGGAVGNLALAGLPAFPKAPAGSTFNPTAPTLFSSVTQLALLAPVGQDTLLALLPPDLRPGAPVFALDAWQEQQALRQAALKETGQALFLAGLGYDAGSGLSAESQQRLLLYQATARFATGQGIKLGVALSAEQRQKLAEPILWYVEQTVSGPDGQTYTALAPRLYLPEGSREALANVAGGLIRGTDVTLAAGAGSVENTGYVVAEDTLTVEADTLTNRARSAAWGSYTQNVDGGYVEVWGDRVQPGGFLSAARLELDAKRIESISGAFLEGGADQAGALEQALGAAFARSENIDHTHTQFRAKSSGGLLQAVALVVAVAVVIYTAGAATELIAAAASETTTATALATGANAVEAAAEATLAASAAASSTTTVAISSAAGAMASNATAQLLTTGNLDVGSVLKSGLTGAISGGVAGYYGSSYGVERLLAETAAGCGAAMISGDSCGNGMKTALVTTSLAWANREMRNSMIAESKLSPGICDTAGNCLSNASGTSAGVEGDQFKGAGGRLDFDELCAQGLCEARLDENDRLLGYKFDDQGRVVFKGGTYTFKDGRTIIVNSLAEYIEARPELRSPMGGLQGGAGKFAMFDYPPGSFWDKVAESFSGPHDTFNRPTWYGPDGNIGAGMTDTQKLVGEITNYLNVIPAAPFAGAVLIPRGAVTAIRSGIREAESKEGGNE